MNRRNFLSQSALGAAAAALSPFDTGDRKGRPYLSDLRKMKNIGIQLFSLPKSLDKDFAGSIRMLAGMGYKEVELYGPYPFSAQSAKERWEAVTPQLGFKGSGFFGKTSREVKTILSDNGIKATSAHTDLDTLLDGMEKLGEAAQVLGYQYVALPAIPAEKRQTLDDYKRMAETFNRIGENAKKVGLKFAYHNHGYGIKPVNGQSPLEIIYDQTDPDLVFFELDIYWTSAGGADPIDYLDRYCKRYRLIHLKDMKEKKQFSGDGGDPSQWIELFPFMTTVGDGVLGVKEIVKKAEKAGVRHFYVEQDMVAEPEIALKRSFDFLKRMGK